MATQSNPLASANSAVLNATNGTVSLYSGTAEQWLFWGAVGFAVMYMFTSKSKRHRSRHQHEEEEYEDA